ncbi:hypothetical protein MNBD_NITROSPINAE01-789 [hydrothermal vent metagenome]|uniref:Tetratricopeptide repeat protein n=1 Tax=hydrothermal vent metagenome TaxID=652676 RepID=A0A3B1CDZ9_9ZZZZ
MRIGDVRAIRKSEKFRRLGKVDRALKVLSGPTAEKTCDVRVLIRRAVLSGSINDLETALLKDPQNGTALFFLAVKSYENGDFDKATQYISKALEVAPDNISAQVLSALISLKTTGSLDPLLALGKNYTATTIKIKSLLLMEIETRISVLDKKDSGAKEHEHTPGGVLGFIFDVMDDVAVWVYWLIQIVPVLFLFIVNGERAKKRKLVIDASRLENVRKPDSAYQKFKAVLELDENDMDALEFLVRYHMEKGEWQKALAFLTRLEKSTGPDIKDFPILKRWRADIFLATKRHDEALKLYTEVENEFALDYILLYRKGLCALVTGPVALALGSFERALSQPTPDLLKERLVRLSELSG